MRTVILLGWSIAAMLLQGCTYSVQPLLTKENLVHDVNLNGDWELVELQVSPQDKPVENKPGKREGLKLSGFDDNSTYDFQMESDQPGETDDYLMKIGKVGQSLFAEISREDTEGPPIKVGLPVYVLAKLEVQKEGFVLTEIEDRQCRALLEKEKLPHMVHLGARNPDIEHTVMLMTTPQLQEFIRKHEAALFTGPKRVFRKMIPAKTSPNEK